MKGRNRGRIFQAEFHAVDCTKQRARDFYRSGKGPMTDDTRDRKDRIVDDG